MSILSLIMKGKMAEDLRTWLFLADWGFFKLVDDYSIKEQYEVPNRDEVEVIINLPEGSGLNVGDTYLYTLGTNTDVDAQGKVLAPIFDGSTELAFLFNSKVKSALP